VHMHVLERIAPGARVAGPEAIELPAGYAIEAVATNLNYPSSASWDPDGNLLIAESRVPFGRVEQTELRILRVGAGGELKTAAHGFDDLISDITVYRGLLYVSHRGKISVVENGQVRDLIAGLPSWGLHQNTAIVFDRTGRMYFGQGTVSNSGVVGPAAMAQLYRAHRVHGHDIPGADVTLTGKNLESMNPVTFASRPTGAFSSWGAATSPGQRIAGARPGQAASGAVMSANCDGSDLRVHAWGLRNPLGLAFGPDLCLYATNQGARALDPRPIVSDPDTLWLIEEGRWYGWPDYYAGRPVTEPSLSPPEAPPNEFLIANHDELLRGRSRPPQPVADLGPQANAAKVDFCLHPDFGFAGQAFIAESGPLQGPREGMPTCLPEGHRVVRVDLQERTRSDFAVNRSRMPASMTGNNGGLERPVEARFGPDGNLYIVDLGVIEFREEYDDWVATPRTGIVWRVTRTPS
jgi:glucose/arabinose dehydrogenase